jgi:hypothetical protein
LECLISLNNFFFNSHLDFFPKILVQWVSEEQGKRFCQHIKEMERRYQGWWNVKMTGDYCWTLHHEIPETSHKRKRNIRSFAAKRKRQFRAIE